MKFASRCHHFFRNAILLITASLLVPAGMVQAQSVPESMAIKQKARILWDFENFKQGWTGQNSVSNCRAERGCLRGTVSGSDPYIYETNSRQMLVAGSAGVLVRIWASVSSPLQLYWENENGGFAESRMVTQTLPANQWTTMIFDLAAHSEWAGKTISRIRLDPGASGVNFAIDYVALVNDFVVPSSPWLSKAHHFESNNEAWTQSYQVSNYRVEEGKLKGSTTGQNSYLLGPSCFLADQGGVVLRFKSDVDANCKLYWSTTAAGFSESNSKAIWVHESDDWQTLKFDLREHAGWKNQTITGLKIQTSGNSGQSFEIDSILLLGIDGMVDADGDLLDGLDELIFASDPSQRNAVPARLTQEKWLNLTHYSTHSLYLDENVYAKPSVVKLGSLESPNLYFDNHFATRCRGYLTAPTTGVYRFWVTGRSGVELYLSDGASKFRKQRIAELNPDAGTAYGVPNASTNLWDMYAPQMSEDISLVAGQKYYLEVVQTGGHVDDTHVGIAWARPGKSREVLSGNHIESYHPTVDDADDDDLPDAWESQYGLDTQDNGRLDLMRQGERGDFDSDGLNNREEFLCGTDPANPDTDGDGLIDSNEVRSYHTNPTVSDAPSGLLVNTLNLSSYNSASSPWTQTSQGLVPSSFRSTINWNFSVPDDGIWMLDVATMLLGDLYLYETVELDVLIDGISIGDSSLIYGLNREALLRVFTPYLMAGNHSLEIRINNAVTRRMVSIKSISLIQPQGADLNTDGIPDWVLSQLRGINALWPYTPLSITSPANLEGTARVRSLSTLNGNTVLQGLDDLHWYADLPLDANAATPFTVSLEPGVEDSGNITWQATNGLVTQTLTIRSGDSLKLIARPASGSTGQSATLNFGPVGWNGTLGATGTYSVQLASDAAFHIYTLTSPGTYKVKAQHANGSSGTLTIVVKKASFSQTPKDLLASMVGSVKFWTSSVSSNAYFEGGDAVHINNPGTVYNGALTLTALPNQAGLTKMIARLQDDGPILGAQSLNIIGLTDVVQNNSDYTYSSQDFPGYYIIRSPIVVTDLPEGATIVITIARAGVTFLDGTKTLTLSASDFVNGFYNLEFLYPESMSGGYCHYIDIYDRDGNYLGRR